MEYEDFSIIDKPKGSKRVKTRRNVVQDRYWKNMKLEAAITKTIHDPMNKLTANEKNCLATDEFDGMNLELPYSVDKHRRWEVTPFTLLENSRNSGTEAIVLERSITHKCYLGTYMFFRDTEDNIHSINYLDQNGNVVEKTSGKMGTILKNLLTNHRVHKRSKDCECCRSRREDPRVEYRMISAHKNQWITTGQITGGNFLYLGGPDSVRCHWKRRYLEDMDNKEYEEENSEEYDILEEKESYRNRRFCLGDFIVDKPVNKKEWVIVQ